ncbi:MAG: cytidylate kinase family protein [candidate division NC10 bacterium]|nr:cytidylate kinase family protein [candidate division NC10 bacterium]
MKEIQHCVRVRLCAPVEARIPRVMARRSVGREEAIELIRKADEGASARIQQFFRVRWGDPLVYDLVINIASAEGHITLTGMVFSNAAKDSVERIVKSVVGVRSVENQVRVFREW